MQNQLHCSFTRYKQMEFTNTKVSFIAILRHFLELQNAPTCYVVTLVIYAYVTGFVQCVNHVDIT